MSAIINYKFNAKDLHLHGRLKKRLEYLIDDTLMLQIHATFERYCEEYTPFVSGTMAQSTVVTPKYVEYRTPYAHYQYIGEVYGPDIPITEDGIIVGWFSPPGQTKHPTGRQLKHSHLYHPKATSYWDQAMMTEKGKQFLKEVKSLIKRRAKQLYG